MEETVKIFSSKIVCFCGQDNAHILRGSVTNNKAEIHFWFECGHERRDIYHFHEGTTYCETQVFLNDRDWDFSVGTFDFRDKERQEAYEKSRASILAKVAAAKAAVDEADNGKA